MNKRRMKYASWMHVRSCINVLNGKMLIISEMPPGGVFWGAPNGRTDDNGEGRFDLIMSGEIVNRNSDKKISGRDDSCYSADSTRQW